MFVSEAEKIASLFKGFGSNQIRIRITNIYANVAM
jgi:hypothetical protein